MCCVITTQELQETVLKDVVFATLQLLTLDLSVDTVLRLRAATQVGSLRTLAYICVCVCILGRGL